MAGRWRTRWRTEAIATAVELIDAGRVAEARAVLIEARDGIPPAIVEPLEPITCARCGHWVFEPVNHRQRYCSARCQRRAAYERRQLARLERLVEQHGDESDE
jgi:hypothetical protein